MTLHAPREVRTRPETTSTGFGVAPQRAYPNPFNPTTVIEFTAPAAGGAARLEVVSASGRLVRTVFEGRAGAGVNRAVWDGTNDQGEDVASGVYFCRLLAGDVDTHTKLVLVR
ncbi:MAG: T9SS type A sorting domain-containing protein [Chloroflexi bacterium]|nr:T9SS type A sorting domain-containing protein [Chloroflexota bacterium]